MRSRASICRRSCGFTAVELLVVVAIVSALVGLVVPAIQRVRAAAWRTQCSNNLRQIGLALHGYEDLHSVFPPGVHLPPDPCSYLTWGARLLPLLEQEGLWAQVVNDFSRQPNVWAPLPPHPGLQTVVPLFICPADGRSRGRVEPEGFDVAFTHYLGVAGKTSFTSDGVLYAQSRISFRDVFDGASQTIMVGERPPSADNRFGWWYAGVGQEMTGSADMILGVEDNRTTFRAPTCAPGPYKFGPGSVGDICDTFHFWSRHIGGAHFLFVDGAVRFLRYDAAFLMPALASRAGSEVVSVPN